MKLHTIVLTGIALGGLALFAACGPEPEKESVAVHECRLDAFVVAADGVTLEGLAADVVVANLPPETIVSINGAGEGRLRIARAVSLEGDVLFESGSGSGTGDSAAWLPAGSVATSSKALQIASPAASAGAELEELPDSEQPTVPIFADADGAAAPVARLTPDEAVNLLDCRGTWAYISATSIEGEAANGWLAPEAQCPNPVTSCS